MCTFNDTHFTALNKFLIVRVVTSAVSLVRKYTIYTSTLIYEFVYA